MKKFDARLVAILAAIPMSQVHALGLGPLTLHSRLGDPLQAQVAVHGTAGEELAANCVTARVTSLDGNLLSKPGLAVNGKGAAAAIQLAGRERLSEPAVRIVVDLACGGSAIRREYPVLLDPTQAVQPANAVQQPAQRPDAAQGVDLQNRASPPAPIAMPTAARSIAPRAAGTPRPPAAPRTGQAPASGSRPALPHAADNLEQVRPRLILQYAGTLSEPPVATGAARPAPSDAGQTRAAGLPAGDDAAAAARAQLQAVERELRTASQSTASLRQELEKEKAVAATERRGMVSGHWLALLAGLLTASAVAALWLWRCRAEDKRRYQNELLILASPFDTPAQPAPLTPPARSIAAADKPPAAAVQQPAAKSGITTPVPVSVSDALPSAPVVATAAPPPAGVMLDWDFAPAAPAAAATAHSAFPPIDSALPLPPAEQPDQEMPEGGLALIDLSLLDLAVPGLLEGPAQEPAQAHASEVAGMLLEAENWMADHNPLRAAEHLRPYLSRADMLSPAPGLYLVALYQTVGDPEQATALQVEMRARFPEMTAAWQTDGQPRRTLAEFPDVAVIMSALSQTSALLPYLESLLLPPYEFDFPVYREIVRAIGAAAQSQAEQSSGTSGRIHGERVG